MIYYSLLTYIETTLFRESSGSSTRCKSHLRLFPDTYKLCNFVMVTKKSWMVTSVSCLCFNLPCSSVLFYVLKEFTDYTCLSVCSQGVGGSLRDLNPEGWVVPSQTWEEGGPCPSGSCVRGPYPNLDQRIMGE